MTEQDFESLLARGYETDGVEFKGAGSGRISCSSRRSFGPFSAWQTVVTAGL